MDTVYVLMHVHMIGETEELKLIGIYTTEQKALAAVDRLRQQPGFRDFPALLDPSEVWESGFQVSPRQLDSDSWSLGFESG